MKTQIKRIPAIIFVVVCGFTFAHHLLNEIWNDEFYTLVNFVLVPLKNTVSDYHVPNNHILFSLFAKAYLSIIGYSDLATVIRNPLVVRLPLVLVALAIFWNYWKITSFFFTDSRWRFISLLLLGSNLVFGNFVFQYRGYGLSMLFLSIIAYQLLRIRFEDQKHKAAYLFLALAAFGAIYTTPSNAYIVVILGMYPVISHFVESGITRGFLNSRAFLAGFSLAAGFFLGILAYLPIISEVFSNKYVRNSSPFAFENFERMLKVFLALSSFHFVLLLFGIYYFISRLVSRQIKADSRYWFPVMVCCLPFLFSFLHGDVPPDRVYSVLLPFFTLLLTYSMIVISQKINFLSPNKIFLLIPVYLLIHFAGSEYYQYKRIAYNNAHGNRDQDLTLQYYNYHFNSSQMRGMLQDELYKDIPVYFEEYFDNTQILTSAVGIKTSVVDPDTLSIDKYILITNKPLAGGRQAEYHTSLMNAESSYFKLYLAERIH